MVVLESNGMTTIGNNQYLQPDYLSSLPTTLDAKKSPLALLAQTCSQIGADSSNVKSIISLDKSNKNKSDHQSSKSPSGIHASNTKMISPIGNHNTSSSSTTSSSSLSSGPSVLAYKPYEVNVLTKSERPSSKDNNNLSANSVEMANSEVKMRVPSRNKTESPGSNSSHQYHDTDSGKLTPNEHKSGGSPGSLSQRGGTSPIIRSGIEVMQGHTKDPSMSMYKPGSYGMNPLSGLGYPSSMEHHTNPAFRPPFAGAFSHHAAMLAAVSGYSNSSAPPGTFVSYARVKTPTGGEALVPVCKDPYCTGCPFSAHNQQMMMGSPCPAGCTQCEHQKYGLAMAMSSLPPGHPYSQMAQRPYVCNWILGESYCGKRFNNSDELLTHLRTHTSNLNDPAAIAALTASVQSPLLNPLGHLFQQSALHRAYTNPPLSPLSASRYHPYAKHGGIPAGLSPSSFPQFNPAFPYYSPYALYGQRLGAAAVHQ